MHTFYNSLRNLARTIIDASTGGALMKKTTDQAYEILEDTSINSNQWPRDRSTPRKVCLSWGRLHLTSDYFSLPDSNRGR